MRAFGPWHRKCLEKLRCSSSTLGLSLFSSVLINLCLACCCRSSTAFAVPRQKGVGGRERERGGGIQLTLQAPLAEAQMKLYDDEGAKMK